MHTKQNNNLQKLLPIDILEPKQIIHTAEFHLPFIVTPQILLDFLNLCSSMVQVLILPLTSLSPFLDISIISPPSYVTNLNIFSVSLVFCFLNEQNISQIIIARNRLYNQLKFSLFCLNMLCFSFVFHLSCHLFEMVFIPPFVGGDVTGTQAWTLHHIN